MRKMLTAYCFLYDIFRTVALFNFVVVLLAEPMERILQQLENPEGDVIESPNM